MDPGEHFSTSLIPDKAKDFLTICTGMVVQINKVSMSIEGNWQDNVLFINVHWFIINTRLKDNKRQ